MIFLLKLKGGNVKYKKWGEYPGSIYKYIYDDISDQLVFDIGSNVGQMVKRFVNVGAKVVAVEPQSELVSHENYEGVFAIRNVCVGDAVGETSFYKCEHHQSSSCVGDWKLQHPTKKWTKTKIEITTLDTLIEEFGKPKYIKIDVEGYEDKVLSGLSQKIDLISFEIVKGHLDCAIKCFELLEEGLGYEGFKIFMKKKIKKDGKTIKLHSYFNDFDNKDEFIRWLKEFPALCQIANRDVADVLVRRKPQKGV